MKQLCNEYLHKNSQTVKKGVAHAKGSMKKVVKSKVGSPGVAVVV